MKHNTRSWKHNRKDRHQYGNRNSAKYSTPFMVLDEGQVQIWENEMGYDNTNDGVEEE